MPSCRLSNKIKLCIEQEQRQLNMKKVHRIEMERENKEVCYLVYSVVLEYEFCPFNWVLLEA